MEPIFDNKEVFYVFIKVINPFVLKTENCAFCVMKYIFKIKVNNNNKNEVIVEYGTNENLTMVEFNLDKKKKKEFYIGRKADCDIVINDSQVSREQAMIYYQDNNWFIKDGGKEKPSGSGTWLFLENKYEIKADTVFMVGDSSIKIDYIPPNSK